MLKDAPSDALVLNHGYEPHRRLTPRASENIDRVRPLQHDIPFQPSLATGVIGDYDVVRPRVNSGRSRP